MANYLGFKPTERDNDYYFVSYSSEDVEYVGSISRKLHDQNIPIWYDYGIDYGKKWEAVITEKIRNCTAVILFFSPQILHKKESYVLIELEMAQDFDKPVYVVLLKNVISKNIPEDTYHYWVRIRRYQGITAFNMNQETVLSELKRALALSPVKPESSSNQPIENNKLSLIQSGNTASYDSAPTANPSDKEVIDVLAEENHDNLFTDSLSEEALLVLLSEDSGFTTSDDSSRKTSYTASSSQEAKVLSAYEGYRKEYPGIHDGLDDSREEIASFFGKRPEHPSSDLLKYVKRYYERCAESRGKSDILTSNAYELMAYITYRDRLYRDAIPLLEIIYQKKKAQLGEFHYETIDVLFMLADANQKKESFLPSFKYQKEFIKLAKKYMGEDSLNISYDFLAACRLCKPWITYEHSGLYPDDSIYFWKILCDYKFVSTYVNERVLHYPKLDYSFGRIYYGSETDQNESLNSTRFEAIEHRLYISDLLYSELSNESQKELKLVGDNYFGYRGGYAKAIYYSRLYFERCLSRLEVGKDNALTDLINSSKGLYDRYKSMHLETCPQAQEAYQKYQELSNRK